MGFANRAIKGAQSRASGEQFEGLINASCLFYESQNVASIEKTPEPMRVIRAYDRNKGQFIACFAKKAQPDYKGILMDSSMILFDAKHTEKDRISRDVVTTEQEECFEKYEKHGARCYLVVSLRFEKFYRVPWNIFRDMKELLGHKYMNESELGPYEVKYKNGVLRFLDGIELREGM